MIRKKSVTISKAHLDASEQRIRASFRDFAQQVTRSFGQVNHQFSKVEEQFSKVDNRFLEVNVKLEAIMEMVSTRKEMLNLIRELRSQGIHLDQTKIFF